MINYEKRNTISLKHQEEKKTKDNKMENNNIKKNKAENRKPTNGQPEKNQKKMTSRQAAAIIGILLLAALYVVTLIVALTDTSSSGKLFALCLFATIAVPMLIWIYTWMYGKLTNRHTFADFELNQQEQPDRADSDT